MARTNRWVFTVNDNARAWAEGLMETIYNNNKDHIRYCCGQLEVAPETGNLHFQGYLQLIKSNRMSWLKSHFHQTAHFEKQRGNNEQARDYCRKEETRAPGAEFIEFGTYAGKKGARSDLVGIKDAIKKGATHRELIDSHTVEYAKYTRFVDRVKSLQRPDPHPEGVRVILYLGEPGTGKTRLAESKDSDAYIVPVNNGSFWLDGYDGQETVILDDFSGGISKFALTQVLRLLDRYPVQVPIKGSHVWWIPKTIYITTNIHPFRWYEWKNRENQYQALWRRFSEVHYFPLEGEPEEQTIPDCFYETDLIWPPEIDLFRPLPINPSIPESQPGIVDQNDRYGLW